MEESTIIKRMEEVWKDMSGCTRFLDDYRTNKNSVQSFFITLRHQLDILERRVTKEFEQETDYLESRLKNDYLQLDYLNRLFHTYQDNRGYAAGFQEPTHHKTKEEEEALANPKPLSLVEIKNVDDLNKTIKECDSFQDFVYRRANPDFEAKAKTNRHLDAEIERVLKFGKRDEFRTMSFQPTKGFVENYKKELEALYNLDFKCVDHYGVAENGESTSPVVLVVPPIDILGLEPFKEIYLKSKEDTRSFCVFDLKNDCLLEHVNLEFNHKRDRALLVSFKKKFIYMFGGRGDDGSSSTYERFNHSSQTIDQTGSLGHVRGEWIQATTDNERYIYLMSNLCRDGTIERFDTQDERFEVLGKVKYLPKDQGFSFLYYHSNRLLIKHEDVKYMESFDLDTRTTSVFHKSSDVSFRCSSQGVFDGHTYIYTYAYTSRHLQRFNIHTKIVSSIFSDPQQISLFNTHPFIFDQASNTIYWATRRSIKSYNVETRQFKIHFSTLEDKLSIYCAGI